MDRRYLWAIVIVITLLSVLIVYTQKSDADDGRICKLSTIKWEPQHNDFWCWVATVSMVLRSYGLDNVEQCHLYDLSKDDATSCKDMQEHPTDWKHMKDASNQEKNNQFGSPQAAAKAYDEHHPNMIKFDTPKEEPFSKFDDLANHVCPSDIRQGRPFIWAYKKGRLAHDVVVYGFNDLGKDEDGEEGDKYLYVYNPDSPPPEQVRIMLSCDEIPDPPSSCFCNELLDPACNGILFESYRDGDPAEFVQDFFIKKK